MTLGLLFAGKGTRLPKEEVGQYFYNFFKLLTSNKKFSLNLYYEYDFLWNSEAFNAFLISSWSISWFSLVNGQGNPIWDQIWIIYSMKFLSKIASCSCINSKVNQK